MNYDFHSNTIICVFVQLIVFMQSTINIKIKIAIIQPNTAKGRKPYSAIGKYFKSY